MSAKDDEKHPPTASGEEQQPADDEFNWEEYMESTGTLAVPPSTFVHVDRSLQSCFLPGMMMEVPTDPEGGCYWVASVVFTSGPLITLRYYGYDDDRSADFWFNMSTEEAHCLGWAQKNNKPLVPPDCLVKKQPNWVETLLGTWQDDGADKSVPMDLLSANGSSVIDQIRTGMKLEVQDETYPTDVWITTVYDNVGGRLLLRYDGMPDAQHDFWVFCFSWRLHSLGWTTAANGGVLFKCSYKPPSCLRDSLDEHQAKAIIDFGLNSQPQNTIVNDILKENGRDLEEHEFKVGMKLETIHPQERTVFCPATVVAVSAYFFRVEIDDVCGAAQADRTRTRMTCHSKSLNLFPPGWCKTKSIAITKPKGWVSLLGGDFDWMQYLKQTESEPAPDQLFNLKHSSSGWIQNRYMERGMKLEAVNPNEPGQICASTVFRTVGHLVWIMLDGVNSLEASHVVAANSHDLFPVGWCESNGYPLKPPHTNLKDFQIFHDKRPASLSGKSVTPDHWCPKIYFNRKCFSGPLLSKSKLTELPRTVGPGPVYLVMKEIMSMVVNAAYIPTKVLMELEFDARTSPTDDADPNHFRFELKAKYKSKVQMRTVEVPCLNSDVDRFCRDLCVRLDCCPYLVGTAYVAGECPDECYKLSKTKYISSYNKKKPKNKDGIALGRGKWVRDKSKLKATLLPSAAAVVDDEEENDEDPEDDEECRKQAGAPEADRSTPSDVFSDKSTKMQLRTPTTAATFVAGLKISLSERLLTPGNCDNEVLTPMRLDAEDAELCTIIDTSAETDPLTQTPPAPPSGGKRLNQDSSDVVDDASVTSTQSNSKRNKLQEATTQQGPMKTRGARLPNYAHALKKKKRGKVAADEDKRESIKLTIKKDAIGNGAFRNGGAAARARTAPLDSINNNGAENRTALAKSDVPFAIYEEFEMKIEQLETITNPLHWTVQDVYNYLAKTADCAYLANTFREQEIDGQALLLLTLPCVQEHLDLKLGPAIKLCHHIERIKYTFFTKFSHTS